MQDPVSQDLLTSVVLDAVAEDEQRCGFTA